MRLMDIMLVDPGPAAGDRDRRHARPGAHRRSWSRSGSTQIPIFARLLRGSMLAQRENDYVLAARSVGVPRRSILASHILPNSISPVIVQATLALATAIIDVAGLGFLGLGPQDPATPEWGTMLDRHDALPPDRAAPGAHPRARDRDLRARLQPDRRRAARGARPEVPRPCLASRSSQRRGPATSSSGPSAGRSTPSTGSRSTSRRARRSGSSASRAAARASPRSRCSGSSPRAGRVPSGHGDVRRPRPAQALGRGAARRSAAARSR